MNQDKLWSAFQNDPNLRVAFQAAPRLRRLLRLVQPGQAVLNIGVGDGSFERMAAAKGAHVSCLDPSEQSIASLRAALDLGDRAQRGYADAIPFPECCFEVVVMSEVMEHLADDVLERALWEVQRVLKPNGSFIGTVPAAEELVRSNTVCPHCGKQFHRWGHVQSFSKERLAKLLSSRFSCVTVQRTYFPEWAQLNWKGKFTSAIKQLLLTLGAQGTQETFLFQARRT